MTKGVGWRPFRLSESKAQAQLESLAGTKRTLDVREALSTDATRVGSLSWEVPGLYVDASKQRWDGEVQEALIHLAEEAWLGLPPIRLALLVDRDGLRSRNGHVYP